MKSRQAKTAMLRARCNPSLLDDIEQIARLQQLDASDIVRMACAQFVSNARLTSMSQMSVSPLRVPQLNETR